MLLCTELGFQFHSDILVYTKRLYTSIHCTLYKLVLLQYSIAFQFLRTFSLHKSHIVKLNLFSVKFSMLVSGRKVFREKIVQHISEKDTGCVFYQLNLNLETVNSFFSIVTNREILGQEYVCPKIHNQLHIACFYMNWWV